MAFQQHGQLPPYERIPYYADYVPDALLDLILQHGAPHPGVSAFVRDVEGAGPNISYEDAAAPFLCAVLERVRVALAELLQRRTEDRAFIDKFSKRANVLNKHLNLTPDSTDFVSVVGAEDPARKNRIAIGEPDGPEVIARVAPLPPHLEGYHVTLFGPADSKKMCANALACKERVVAGEPDVVRALVDSSNIVPKWGADDEDSKTPLRAPFLDSMANLAECYGHAGKAQPFKRIPGLALPSASMAYRGDVVPLHIYDFAMHIFHMHRQPEALTFYVPKLENEEEAEYLGLLARTAEELVKEHLYPQYELGTVRFLLVLENPRAVFRINEMMHALYPYFAGASLGWHDYLAAAGRVFREDESYRMPCKSDPEIVVRHIRESHLVLARTVKEAGGIAIGGMYGVLPLERRLDSQSMQATLSGFVRDLVYQLRRGLDGFWLAHPDFMRFGIAVVEAFARDKKQLPPGLNLRHALPPLPTLESVIRALVLDCAEADRLVHTVVRAPDGEGLDPSNPIYHRALLAAELAGDAAHMQNNDEREVRYNVFQALQYLADWLRGNGCVALPSTVNGVGVRVMDDLATTERSRWEVWAEIAHGRFPLMRFVAIVHEEYDFIRQYTAKPSPPGGSRGRFLRSQGASAAEGEKRPAVLFDKVTAKWYPVALRLLLALATLKNPAEFATELLVVFTNRTVREHPDPLSRAVELHPRRLWIDPAVYRASLLLSAVPISRIVSSVEPLTTVQSMPHADLLQAYYRLDPADRPSVPGSDQQLREFFAQRMRKYLEGDPLSRSVLSPSLLKGLKGDPAIQIVLAGLGGTQLFTEELGTCNESTLFQIASLSKPISSAFMLELLAEYEISIEARVNDVFARFGSPVVICTHGTSAPCQELQLIHLLTHTGLEQHYVFGFNVTDGLPPMEELIANGSTSCFGGAYDPVEVHARPGSRFQYSGAGFMVVQALIEAMTGLPIGRAMAGWVKELELGLEKPPGTLPQLVIDGEPVLRDLAAGKLAPLQMAFGNMDNGDTPPVLAFPPAAAGAVGSARGLAVFLTHLTAAYHSLDGSGPISHDTAVWMLGQPLRALSPEVRRFMAADMGVGVFVSECGPNRVMMHQAANDGYRGMFAWCFDGPQRGAGFVALASGDNALVPILAKLGRQCFGEYIKMEGFNVERLERAIAKLESGQLGLENIPQEQIVNQGFKQLFFDGFDPYFPPLCPREGRHAHRYAQWDVAAEAEVVSVTDERFAQARNLVDPLEPMFDPAAFTPAGKQMDSWESQRHNDARTGDVAVFRLRRAAPIGAVEVSTMWHDGNQATAIAVEGRTGSGAWVTLLPRYALLPHAWHRVVLAAVSEPVDMLRVANIPDGGITRLRCYEQPPDEEWQEGSGRYADEIPSVTKATQLHTAADQHMLATNPTEAELHHRIARIPPGTIVNVASSAYGAGVTAVSNEHYGPAAAILSPALPRGMFDGFETARGRGEHAQEYVSVRFRVPAFISHIIIDMQYFVNNNPAYVAVEADIDGEGEFRGNLTRRFVPCKAYRGNKMRLTVPSSLRRVPVYGVRVRTRPCGGFNRLRVMGTFVTSLQSKL